jgi:MoaA/NifB/PqqE/SkfB family radical SAM enzyme
MAAGSQTLRRLRAYATFAAQTMLLRRARPYLFVLIVNDRCNLDCFYCTSKNTGRFEMEWAAVRRALSEAHRRGHRALVLTGGEPTLWRSDGAALGDVVGYARGIGFLDIAVFTNGTQPLEVEGITYIVTIDGTREAHNYIRAGTYDLILENVRAARSKVMASMTLSKANADRLEEAVHEMAATGLFSCITFNLLTHEPQVVARYGVTGEERVRLLDRIWALKRAGYPVVLSRAAYRAMRANDWTRPIRQIELYAGGRLYTCCRDVGNPEVCRNCGYGSCVEVAQALAGRASAALQLLKAK